MTGKQRVKIIRAVFPRYDQPLDSKCNNPRKYGVQRTPDAEALLNGYASPDRAGSPRNGFRTKPHKHTFWLSEAQEARLHMTKRLSEAHSLQEVVEAALELYNKTIIEGEKEHEQV